MEDWSFVTMTHTSLSHQSGTGSLPRTPKVMKRRTPVMLMSCAAAVDAAKVSAAAESRATLCWRREMASKQPPAMEKAYPSWLREEVWSGGFWAASEAVACGRLRPLRSESTQQDPDL